MKTVQSISFGKFPDGTGETAIIHVAGEEVIRIASSIIGPDPVKAEVTAQCRLLEMIIRMITEKE